MKRIDMKLGTVILIILFLAGCSPSGKKSEAESETVEMKYNVYKAPDSFPYPDVTLKLIRPTEMAVDTGDVTFKFEVTNYELGIQTPDAADRRIANSAKGQHIHFIVNNGPYSAHYEPEFSKKFEEGNYVILAFPSRSYHEAVKNDSSYVLTKLTVGNPGEEMNFDPKGQHLFFSRPKGTYSGTDTEKLMIDFFLINTSISEGGNKVRATINGEEHIITEWAPYYIEDLGKGEVTIRLELVDKNGKLIPGPFNSVERKVTLE